MKWDVETPLDHERDNPLRYPYPLLLMRRFESVLATEVNCINRAEAIARAAPPHPR